jgi:hypothetical protein
MPQSDITPPTWSCTSISTPLTSWYPKHGAFSGVCFSWATNPVAAVIKNVVTSAAESEVGACFHNAQSGAPLRLTLTNMVHTQPPTPLRTDNYTAYGIVNERIKQKRSKAMDMRYHWMTDRVRQKQFNVYWRPG